MGQIDAKRNKMIKNQGCREKLDGFEREFEDESTYILCKWKDCSNGLDTSRVIYEHFKFLDLRRNLPMELCSTEQVFGVL
jgi:hypothetical protein